MNIVRIKELLALFSVLLLALQAPCRAEDSPRVAVVDLAGAVFASREAKRHMEELRKSVTYQRFKQTIESAQADLSNLQNRMTLPQLTQAQRQTLQQRIDHISAEATENGHQLQQWLNARKQAIFDELAPDARKAIEALVAERKLDVVVPRDAIIYARESWVLTDSLTHYIDQYSQP